MSSIKYHARGTHFKGPLLGDRRAAGGMLKNFDIGIQGFRDTAQWKCDFMGDVTTALGSMGWTTSNIGSPTSPSVLTATAGTGSIIGFSTIIGLGLSGGWLAFDPGTAASTGIEYSLDPGAASQGTGMIDASGSTAALQGLNNLTWAWEARFLLSNYGQAGGATDFKAGAFIIGMGTALNTNGSTRLSTAGAYQNGNSMYFRTATNTTALIAGACRGTSVSVKNEITTQTFQNHIQLPTNAGALPALANNTPIRVGMRGRTDDVTSATATQWIEVYVDGAMVGVLQDATNGVVPNVAMTPFIGMVNGASLHPVAAVDYFWVAVDRSRTVFNTNFLSSGT
jgi:hypothetical protein